MAGCEIQYIGNDMEIGVPLLIVLGLIFTMWAASVFIVGVNVLLFWFILGGLLFPTVLALLILLVSTAFALFYGVKTNNPKLVYIWYIIKIIECILLSIGVAVNIPNMIRWHQYCYFLIGLLLLPLGVYLVLSVKEIYNNMTSPSSSYQEIATKRSSVSRV